MNKLSRCDCPDCLSNWEKLGAEFKEKRETNPSHSFSWRNFKGQSIRTHLIPVLEEMTKNHCSFCDGYPLGTESRQTIEHFRPKSRFPELAYQWENLFLCCDVCQSSKQEEFDEKLLKPDDPDYCFSDFFTCNFKSGIIEPNPQATQEKQERARITIKLYDLNSTLRSQSRLRQLKKFEKNTGEDINTFPYRYFINASL